MGTTNLPLQLTSFVGRQREMAEVERLLFSSRLITLTGAGGSGKTRLAIQITSMVYEAYKDGGYWVDLVPLRDPDLIPAVIAQALGLHLVADQPALESLLSFVRPKQLLLILDNCEHLSEACAQLAEEILCNAPDFRILATSRVPLAVAGETIYPVSGLAWPEFDRKMARNGQIRLDLQDVLSYEAVKLFVERLRLVSPNFDLTPDNTYAIADICRRLDGLPLALELASARANVLTVQEIAAHLDHRFTLLTSAGRIGLDPRHATLRAAIDWSYALLTAEEQTLFRRLAVFAAGCTLDTAEAVCGGQGIAEGRTLDLLSSLVDKSLLVAETTGRAQAHYRLLETIREYACEKLDESGEGDRLRDRHLELFLARAEEAATKMGDAYQKLWLNWLESENDNLRAALAWALESHRIEMGLRIANSLVRFWEIRGSIHEGQTWFERFLAQADETISLEVRVNAIVFLSFIAMFLGNPTASVAYGRQAVDLVEAAPDENKRLMAFALAGLSSGARAAGDFQTAYTIGVRVIQYNREIGPSFYLGMALLAQGDLALDLGQFDTARALLEESLTLAREAGDSIRVAFSLNTLGDVARSEGKYTDALSLYEQSEALCRELGAPHQLPAIMRNIGRTYLHLGEIERALTLFSESLALHQAQHEMAGMTECLIGFAAVAIRRGYPAAGARLLGAANVYGKRNATFAWPVKRMEYEEYRMLARASLTEAEFQAAQSAGSAMSLEQAIDYALNLPLHAEAATVVSEKKYDLTGREREVAALIAQGKSNREIAEALVLSTRTVEKHVANILAKLGLASRAQVVRWAMEHELK